LKSPSSLATEHRKKRVLIISPYFAPCSTPDMQRVRMSLPYFEQNGWEAEVVCVDPDYTDLAVDPLLMQTIPAHIPIHYTSALTKEKTFKFGLGSLALRAMYYINKKVSTLLSQKQFDLIYFSTTQFPICILGRKWKESFGVPYLIDMQDPWHTDYYQSKSKAERPKKYWFSYRLNKWLEPYAMAKCDGLIAVSKAYLTELNSRYPHLAKKPQQVIPFGYSTIDHQLATSLTIPVKNTAKKQLVYAGVLGKQMTLALNILFTALQETNLFQKAFELSFLGTSYASKNPERLASTLASSHQIANSVKEEPTRMSPFKTIKELQAADGLLIIGTDDPSYVASKVFPYLLTRKPILAIVHSESAITKILSSLSNTAIIFIDRNQDQARVQLEGFLNAIIQQQALQLDEIQFSAYHAAQLTKAQTDVFNRVYSNQFL
jgi:glycosyltransferase involved in cell wall biosynthesis